MYHIGKKKIFQVAPKSKKKQVKIILIIYVNTVINIILKRKEKIF